MPHQHQGSEHAAHDTPTRPLIWVLKGVRKGDTAQAMELALQLGGRVEGKQLAFNASQMVPNVLLGSRVSHLTPEAKQLLSPPWPDVVVATGRRTAPVALWIKRQSLGKTKLVQIGRPRMPLADFDLVVTTAQYGLPSATNVVRVPLPFASPKQPVLDELLHFQEVWTPLPKPWILGVIGGGKFPLRLDDAILTNFGEALQRRAKAVGGSVVLLDSPRSPIGALDRVGKALEVPHWQFVRGKGPNPYQSALQLCDELAVTGDSVSMVSEMVLTGKLAWVFPLPRSAFAPRWSVQRGILAELARLGIFHPPRDTDGFMQNLLVGGHVGDLMAGVKRAARGRLTAAHDVVLTRIKSMLMA